MNNDGYNNYGTKVDEKTPLTDDTSWYTSYPQDQESTYYLPFIPEQFNLDKKAMALNATHPSSG